MNNYIVITDTIETKKEKDGKKITEQKEKQLMVKTVFVVSKTEFNVNEYEYLREFYNKVISKLAEQIVIRKKS